MSIAYTNTTAQSIPEDFNGELQTPFGTVHATGAEHDIGHGNLTGIKSDNFEDGMEYLSATCPVTLKVDLAPVLKGACEIASTSASRQIKVEFRTAEIAKERAELVRTTITTNVRICENPKWIAYTL